MPEAEEASSRAFWAAALANPLPALGVCREVRPTLLQASARSAREREKGGEGGVGVGGCRAGKRARHAPLTYYSPTRHRMQRLVSSQWAVGSGLWSVSVLAMANSLAILTSAILTRLTTPRCALSRCAPSKHSPSKYGHITTPRTFVIDHKLPTFSGA